MDETKQLILLAQNGNAEAKDKLISQNTGLIWSIAKRFLNRGYELEDLYQIGALGLLKCIDKFDIGYDVKFSTYAVPMIMGEIKRFLRDDGMIKIARPLKEISIKARRAQENFIKENGKSPTIKELAKILDTDQDELIMALDSNRNIESIYQTITQSDGSTTFLIDKIKCADSNSDIIDKIAVSDIINKLDESEREIIVQRYFNDKTQTEIASLLNISQVQVSRMEKKILMKMRKNF